MTIGFTDATWPTYRRVVRFAVVLGAFAQWGGCSTSEDDEIEVCTLVACASNLVGALDTDALAADYEAELEQGPLELSFCPTGQACGVFRVFLSDVDPGEGATCVPTSDTAMYLCCDAGCRTSEEGELLITMPLPDDPPDTGFTVSLFDAGGQSLATTSGELQISTYQPNGPDCGPTCYTGVATLDALWGSQAGTAP